MRADIRRIRLGKVCDVERGGSPRPIDSYITDSEEGVNWIKIGDADHSMYITRTAQKIRPEGVKKSRVVHAGDFLLSNSMSFGRPYILKIDGCIHDGWLVLHDRDNVFYKPFLYYYLSAPTTYSRFKAMAVGGVVNNLNSKMVRDLEVPLLPLDEQKRIAAKLDLLCGIISKREEQLAKLKQLAKSRFVEMFGDAIWPKTTIGELSEFLTSGSRGWAKYYSDEGELFITIKNVKNTRISVDDVQYIVPPQGAEADRTRVKEGDLLISITADLGRTGVVTDEIASRGAYINQHLTRISLKRNVVDPLYAAFYIESPEGKGQIERRNQSAVKAGLNFESIRSIQLPLPPIGEQRKFAAFVAELDKSEFAIRKSLETYRKLYRQQVQEVFG